MYRKTQHSVYSITLHLVLVVKYRRDVINNTISKRIKDIFETIWNDRKRNGKRNSQIIRTIRKDKKWKLKQVNI